jgi:hypothetical protein
MTNHDKIVHKLKTEDAYQLVGLCTNTLVAKRSQASCRYAFRTQSYVMYRMNIVSLCMRKPLCYVC